MHGVEEETKQAVTAPAQKSGSDIWRDIQLAKAQLLAKSTPNATKSNSLPGEKYVKANATPTTTKAVSQALPTQFQLQQLQKLKPQGLLVSRNLHIAPGVIPVSAEVRLQQVMKKNFRYT